MGSIAKNIRTGENFRFGLKLFEEIEAFESFKGLSMPKCQALFVHGTANKVVPCNYYVQFSDYLVNGRFELIEWERTPLKAKISS